MSKIKKMTKKLKHLEQQQSIFLSLILECNQNINQVQDSLVLQNRTIDTVDEVLERYNNLEQAENEDAKSFDARKKAVLMLSPRNVRKIVLSIASNKTDKHTKKYHSLLKATDKQKKVLSQWDLKLVKSSASLAVIEKDIKLLKATLNEKMEVLNARKKRTIEVTPEMVMRKTLQRLENKERKDAKRMKMLLSAFGLRFLENNKEVQKRTEEHIQALKSKSSKSTKDLRMMWFLHRQIEAITESSKTPWLVGVEALKEAKVVNGYQNLLAKKREIMRLYAEGGAVEDLAAKRFQELAVELEGFVEELVFLKDIIDYYCDHLATDENDSVTKAMKEMHLHFSQVAEVIKEALVSHIQEGIQGAFNSLGSIFNKNIFSLLSLRNSPELIKQKLLPYIEDKIVADTTVENFMERLDFCYNKNIDMFIDDQVIEGTKYDALANLNALIEAEFDFNHNLEVIEKVSSKLVDLQTKEEIQSLLKLSNWKIAASSYQELSTISLKKSVSGSTLVSTASSYAPLSLFMRYAPNVLIKVENDGVESQEVGFIAETVSRSLGLAMLTSAGGGRTFLTKGAIKAFASLSNSLVDVKAYIASLAGSACREEWLCDTMMGVKLFVLYGPNGKPVIEDGKFICYLNGNEGSAWYQYLKDNLCLQFRAVDAKWATEHLVKINQAQREQIVKDETWVKGIKSFYQQVAFYCERLAQRNAYPFYLPKSKEMRTLSMNDVYSCIDGVKEIFYPGKKNKEFFHMQSDDGKKILFLPRLSADLWDILPDEVRAVLPSREQIAADEKAADEKAAEMLKDVNAWVNKVYFAVEETDRVIFDQFKVGQDVHWLRRKLSTSSIEVLKSFNKVYDINNRCNHKLEVSLSHAECIWENVMLLQELVRHHERQANIKFAFPNGRSAIDLAKKALNPIEKSEELQFIRSCFSQATLEALDSKRKASVYACSHNIQKHSGSSSFKVSKQTAGTGASWIAENFAQILIEGKSFAQVKKENENNTKYPEYEGMETVYGATVDNAPKTSMLGKGMMAPIDIGTFRKLEGVTVDNINGTKLSVLPKAVFNPYDGIAKNVFWKSYFKKLADKALKEKFRMLNIEDQADKALIEDYRAKGYTWRIHGYTIGDLHKSAVMIMRKLDKGRTQCTSQATEKMVTGLYREKPTEQFINATEESTNKYLAYLGALYVGGKYSRKELPQVPGVELENFKKYLSANTISFTEEVISCKDYQASQKYITETSSKSKLPCVVSKDKFILDGHHRWYANDEVNAIVVDLSLEELIEVTSEFDGSWFNTEPTRYELLMQLTGLFKGLKSFDKDGNACSDFMINTNIENEGFPLHMFINMMGALCKMDGPTLVDSIEENVLNGADSELAAALVAMGADLHSSATLTAKKAESFDKKLSNYIRGAVIKGMNLVAQVYDDLPDDTIMLPSQLKGTTLGKLVLALIWRYPIASATSVSEVKVVYSDDPKYTENLKRYGFNLKNFPMMILLPSALKTSFQYDDDGDYFGCLPEPSFNKRKFEETFARAVNEVTAFNNGDYSAIENLKKLWKKYQGWIMVSAIHLKRSDYWAQNIEMLDIITANNKKNMKIIDVKGDITENFTKWGHRDGRGPVGLISDLFTVILASGLQGPEFTMLACACAYILQHSIDSAKKEKLVICAHILLNGYLWTQVNGKMELFPFVNDIVKLWNELWENHSENEDDIKALEITAANELFKALGGSVSIEECYWLPSIETIKAAAYKDNALVYYAPSTLLADMAKLNPPAGRYSIYELFDQEVPVHPEYIDAIDPTRYMVKHCLELVDIISPLTGDVITWKQSADFRKIRLRDYIDYKIVYQEDTNGRLIPYVTWPELPDAEGFSLYWNDDENGFACIETQSIPNSVFKNVLRWACEQTYGGKLGLQDARNVFLKKTDSNGKVIQEHNMIPVGNAPKRNIPWDIALSDHLLQDQMNDTFANANIKIKMEDGYPDIELPADYELSQKLAWAFVSYANIEIPKELLDHASDEFKFAPGSFKDQYNQLPVEKRQIFLRRIRAYLVRWFVAKISLPAYKEATPAMYKRIVELNGLIANANGHDKALLEEEKRELTRNKINDDGDVRYFVHAPDNFQILFESKINSLFEEQITNYGRKPNRRYKLPFNNGYNWVKVPHWFSGTHGDWINTCIAAVNDLVLKGFVRELGFSTCTYNEKFVEEIKSEDLYVDPEARVKVIDDAKVIAFMQTHNQFHLEATGRTIYDCESCMKSMRKHTTEVGRNAKYVRGTKEFTEHKVNESATKLAKACIESIEAQCKTVVRKGIEDEAYFDANPYGISKESALEYIKIKGSDATKVRFGFATVYQEELFESWDKLWRSTNKEYFIEVVENLNDCAWFTLTVEYLIYAGETIKEWLKEKQGSLDLKTQKQFEGDDTEPTPPSGGGGGGIPSKPVASTPEPKVEQPKVEQPKVEQPKVEQPKVEQPKVEKPKTEQLEVQREKAPIKIEIIKNENISFDEHQSKVITGVLRNFKTMNEQTLAGPAGCGKTTIAMEIVKRFKDKACVTALTGAAALVLKTKLDSLEMYNDCSTTHSLLLSPDTSGNGLNFKSKAIQEWQHQKEVLVVIDEASMASVSLVSLIRETVRATRRRFNTQIKLLWMGDPYQLHPVNVQNKESERIGIDLDNPTFMLDKIYRNGGQILSLATAIRNSEPEPKIDTKKGDVIKSTTKWNASTIAEQAIWGVEKLKSAFAATGASTEQINALIEKDGVRIKDSVLRYQTIVHSNNARNDINKAMRAKLGFSGSVQEEEILVMFKDNGSYVNSEQLKVLKVTKQEKLSEFLGKDFVSCDTHSLYFDPQGKNIHPVLIPADLSENTKPLSFHSEAKAIFWVLDMVDCRLESEGVSFDYSAAKSEIERVLKLPLDQITEWLDTAPALYQRIVETGKFLYDNMSEADYGYAITCHKSQGGEWRRIFVIKEWHMFQKDNGKAAQTEDTKRWYYTATTRARERLVLVDYSKW